MLGLVRLRMLRVGISRYSTARFDSRSRLSAARRAMPTSAMPHFRLLFACLQVPFCRVSARDPVDPVVGGGPGDSVLQTVYTDAVIQVAQSKDEGQQVIVVGVRVIHEEHVGGF